MNDNDREARASPGGRKSCRRTLARRKLAIGWRSAAIVAMARLPRSRG
jgi:hypothetical protein